MKKKTRYLDFYRKHLRSGEMPYRGLCFCFPFTEAFGAGGLFSPDRSIGYWGFSGEYITGESARTVSDDYYNRVTREFTPLRQTIVLFLAAMNNEL